MKLKSSFIAVMVASLGLAVGAHAQLISTETGWNGSDGVSSFGNTGPAATGFPQFYNTPIFGQTFSAPTGFNLLNSFRIDVSPRADFNTPTTNGLFKASVAVYNTATQTIGSVLWSSGNVALSATPGFTAYTFAPMTLLASAQTYVFFAEEISGAGSYKWGGSKADLYTGGTFVYSNTPGGNGVFVPFTTTVADAAFTAVFSNPTALTPVPEPSTYALFGAAGCMALAARRRFRRATT